MMTVWVCVVALPPMLATMGMRMASTVSWAMLFSNMAMTAAAAMAVPRLMTNHGRRWRVVCKVGANKSSLSSNPTARAPRRALSLITTSSTSSMVMRPNKKPRALTTARLCTSYFSNTRTTSSDVCSGCTVMGSLRIISCRLAVIGALSSRCSETVPSSLRRAFTTNTVPGLLGRVSLLSRRKASISPTVLVGSAVTTSSCIRPPAVSSA